MDLTIGFVSQNLLTQTNFFEFQDSQIFHEFRNDKCPAKTQKTRFLGNNLSKVHLE